MSNTLIPAGVDYITATLLLSAVNMPANSLWKGEVDLSSLTDDDKRLPIEYSQLTRATLDAIDGLNFRVLDQTFQPETRARDNVYKRLFFVIENTTSSVLNFTNARLILGGRGASVGFPLPRTTQAALTPTTGTPFTITDRDGAALDANHATFSVLPIVATVTHADSANYAANAGHALTADSAVVNRAHRTTNSNTTVVPSDGVILCDASSAPLIVSLPDPATVEGKTFDIVKVNATFNVLTIQPPNGQTVSGLSLVRTMRQWENFTIFSNGLQYIIL